MRVYLDICCLKRPFDDQSQPRIVIETAAVLAAIRGWLDGRLVLLRSTAHDIENDLNSNPHRAAIVRGLLARLAATGPTPAGVGQRVLAIEACGIRSFDAFHLAWAEYLRADFFVTVDDRLARRATRLVTPPLRVAGPVSLIEELPI